jgi:GxxExxY protein
MAITAPEDLVDGRLTGRILDCALIVHRALGPGLLESAYRACLLKEFDEARLRWQAEVAIPVVYKGTRIPGAYRADLIVEDLVIVELKAVDELQPIHNAQLLTYLKLSGLRVGLLLNFNALLLKHGTKRLIV